jgi:hypothetical protein
MAEKPTNPETQSIEQRRLIGQAIIDGILTPRQVALVDLRTFDYNQSAGNYTQRGGGNYTQSGGGNYNQAPLQRMELESPG